MNRLDAVRKNITEMSEEELREHIRQIRIDRKITKGSVTVRKTKAVRSDRAKGKVKSALDAMSQAQMLALLAELEGNDGPT